LDNVVVSIAKVQLLVPVALEKLPESTRTCTAVTPTLSEAVPETVTFPETVAPEAGEVIETVGGVVSGGGVGVVELSVLIIIAGIVVKTESEKRRPMAAHPVLQATITCANPVPLYPVRSSKKPTIEERGAMGPDALFSKVPLASKTPMVVVCCVSVSFAIAKPNRFPPR
jgi:hypothetical protein